MSYVITATKMRNSKESAYSEPNVSSSSGSSQVGIISNSNMVNISKSLADGGKTTVGAVEPCVVSISQDNVP